MTSPTAGPERGGECFVCPRPATHVIYGYPCCRTHGTNLYTNWSVTGA